MKGCENLLISDVNANMSIELTGNNTNSLTLKVTYPSIDSTLSTYDVDLLLISESGFISGDTVDITVNGTPTTGISLPTANAIWLSDLISTPRVTIDTKNNSTDEYTFTFTNPHLLKFQVISAESTLFTSTAQDLYTNGINGDYTLIIGTSIDPQDESAVLALRHAIDNTDTSVAHAENIITINNTYPTFGSQLYPSFLMDSLIVFEKTVPLGTEITVRKDGNIYKTVQLKKNVDAIWFYYELLEETRPFLKDMVDEEWTLEFVYNHTINVQLITGELSAFTSATHVVNEIPSNLHELANSETLNIDEIIITTPNFIVDYDSYTKKIRTAKLDIANGQFLFMDFVKNPETEEDFLRIKHEDTVFNVSIDLILSVEGVREYLKLLRDIGRQMNRVE